MHEIVTHVIKVFNIHVLHKTMSNKDELTGQHCASFDPFSKTTFS